MSAQGRIRVELYRGTELIGSHLFEDGPISVGRGLDNDIVLEDPRASEVHAMIERGGDGKLAVRDRGSESGTLLNGVPVTTRALTDGDEVLVGDTWLVIRLVAGDGELVTEPDLLGDEPTDPELSPPSTPTPPPIPSEPEPPAPLERDTVDEISTWLNTPDVTDIDELDLALPWEPDDIESTFDGEMSMRPGPVPLAELESKSVLAGEFRVGEEVAREAGVLVYSGEHLALQRPVFIVLLHRSRGLQLAGRESYLGMVRELALSRHPNIPEVFDAFEIHTQVGAVIEAVSGESLRERMIAALHTPLERAEITSWVTAMLSALQVVHGQGHSLGGLHPDAVIRREDGTIIVPGVVQPRFQVVLSPNVSSSEHIAPTLDEACYMAPEWIAGGTALDGRADLYAVGCILYEMLAGRPLFYADTLSEMLAAQLDHVPDFEPVREVAPDWVPVLERVLAKDPAERFRDVASFREALHNPASVRPPSSRSGVFRHLAVMLAPPEDASDTDEFDTASLLAGRGLDDVVMREHILKPDVRDASSDDEDDAAAADAQPAEDGAQRESGRRQKPQRLRDVFDVVREQDALAQGGSLSSRDVDSSPMRKRRSWNIDWKVAIVVLLGLAGVATMIVLLTLVLRPRLGESVQVELDQSKGEVSRMLGQSGTGSRDVVVVPGGAARVGARPVPGMAWSLSFLPERVVDVAPFVIDRHEVSRGDFAQCVELGGCSEFPDGMEPNTPREKRLPVTRVTWSEADAYCRHVGMRLPTEAEWEKAARGTRGMLYPWGDDFRCGAANVTGEACEKGERTLKPVDGRSLDVSPYGALNMAGNAWEWTADPYYEPSASVDPGATPRGRAQGRVVKGGDFGSEPRAVFSREWNREDARSPRGGFRCARSLPHLDRPSGSGALFGVKESPNHVLDELLLDAPQPILPRSGQR